MENGLLNQDNDIVSITFFNEVAPDEVKKSLAPKKKLK